MTAMETGRGLRDKIVERNSELASDALFKATMGLISSFVAYGLVGFALSNIGHLFLIINHSQLGFGTAFLAFAVVLGGLLSTTQFQSNRDIEDQEEARRLLNVVIQSPTNIANVLSGGQRPSVLGFTLLFLDGPGHLVDALLLWKRRLKPSEEVLEEAQELFWRVEAIDSDEEDPRSIMLLLLLNLANVRMDPMSGRFVVKLSKQLAPQR